MHAFTHYLHTYIHPASSIAWITRVLCAPLTPHTLWGGRGIEIQIPPNMWQTTHMNNTPHLWAGSSGGAAGTSWGTRSKGRYRSLPWRQRGASWGVTPGRVPPQPELAINAQKSSSGNKKKWKLNGMKSELFASHHFFIKIIASLNSALLVLIVQ